MTTNHAKFHLYRQHGSAEKLREAMSADPAVRAEAEVELAAVIEIPRERSVVAHEYREFLMAALA